jgi:hypothetical protein
MTKGVNSSMIYLIHYKNFCKCHNVPLAQQQKKKIVSPAQIHCLPLTMHLKTKYLLNKCLEQKGKHIILHLICPNVLQIRHFIPILQMSKLRVKKLYQFPRNSQRVNRETSGIQSQIRQCTEPVFVHTSLRTHTHTHTHTPSFQGIELPW